MAFKMKGFSGFTKTVDPIIGGNKKKKIDPALNQDNPNYKPSFRTKQELKKNLPCFFHQIDYKKL